MFLGDENMNQNLVNDIKSLLVPKEDREKKQVALFLPQHTIDKLDNYVSILSKYSDGKVNRNILIQKAIDCLLESIPTAIDEFENEYEKVKKEPYDTILVPSQSSGEAFILENQYWEYTKINPEKLKYLKYFALYLGHPVQQIKYWAEIDSFEEVTLDNQKKYRIYFKGAIHTITPGIPLKDLNAVYTRPIRYIKKEKLLRAKEYKDII